MNTSRRSSQLAPEYPLLGLIISQPSHGYQLHQLLQKELGELWRISMSQAYNILKRLEQQGYIEGSDSPQKKGPDRYELQATAAGRAHFRQWLLAPSGIATQALRVEFLTRLYFARTDSEKLAAQVIHGQIEATSEGLKQLRKRQSLLAPSSQINEWALQLRIRQLGSFLDWLKQLNPNSIHQHPAEGDSTIR